MERTTSAEVSGALREQWDRLSAAYQSSVRISTDDVHYGPCGPGERALGLLGDVRGTSVLELGCGGGQNCVALSGMGAHATGVDFSVAQLRHARELNERRGTTARFSLADLDRPLELSGRRWDTVLSSFAVEYVASLPRLLASVYELLRPHGRLVLCDLHPLVSSADVVGVKAAVRGWIEENWNHAFLVNSEDRAMITALASVAESRIYQFQKAKPTAENMARALCLEMRSRLGALVTSATVWETSEQHAVYRVPSDGPVGSGRSHSGLAGEVSG